MLLSHGPGKAASRGSVQSVSSQQVCARDEVRRVETVRRAKKPAMAGCIPGKEGRRDEMEKKLYTMTIMISYLYVTTDLH